MAIIKKAAKRRPGVPERNKGTRVGPKRQKKYGGKAVKCKIQTAVRSNHRTLIPQPNNNTSNRGTQLR